MTSRTPLLAALLSLASLPALAQSSVEEIIAGARDQIAENLRNSDVGAGYSQMLNFFVDPSISASRLDADDGTRYDVFKLPLQYEIPVDDGAWQLALRGTLSHASAENEFNIGERISGDGTWKADSALIGIGAIVPTGERLSWFVGGQFGISRLQNDTSYSGELGDIVAPIFDGVLFNWDTNARIGSLTGGLNYRTQPGDDLDLRINGRYTYSHIASYSESRDLQAFSENAGTLAGSAELEHRYGASLWDLPLFGVARLGATAFTGSNRNALGFNHFYSIGYSVGLNVGKRSRYFEGFTLGGQFNIGNDVDGFSVVLGWQPK